MTKFTRAVVLALFAAAMTTLAAAQKEPAQKEPAKEEKDQKEQAKEEKAKGEVLKTVIDATAAFDKEKKTLTMVGDGMGMDGKPAKWKSVTTMKDKDTMHMSMYVGDAKDPMFTVTYKRKK